MGSLTSNLCLFNTRIHITPHVHATNTTQLISLLLYSSHIQAQYQRQPLHSNVHWMLLMSSSHFVYFFFCIDLVLFVLLFILSVVLYLLPVVDDVFDFSSDGILHTVRQGMSMCWSVRYMYANGVESVMLCVCVCVWNFYFVVFIGNSNWAIQRLDWLSSCFIRLANIITSPPNRMHSMRGELEWLCLLLLKFPW